MITFDEGTEAVACCNEQPSANLPATASNGQSSTCPALDGHDAAAARSA